jgi:hypothetical protein
MRWRLEYPERETFGVVLASLSFPGWRRDQVMLRRYPEDHGRRRIGDWRHEARLCGNVTIFLLSYFRLRASVILSAK